MPSVKIDRQRVWVTPKRGNHNLTNPPNSSPVHARPTGMCGQLTLSSVALRAHGSDTGEHSGNKIIISMLLRAVSDRCSSEEVACG